MEFLKFENFEETQAQETIRSNLVMMELPKFFQESDERYIIDISEASPENINTQVWNQSDQRYHTPSKNLCECQYNSTAGINDLHWTLDGS